MTTAEAAKAADMIMILVSDHIQGDLYENDIAPHMTPGKTLMFAHGFNIHFGEITPPAGCRRVDDRAQGARAIASASCTPKAWACPALVAVHQDASGKALQNALAYALALGCLKAGVIETNFQGRDRERSVRRAGRALRRRQRADPRRVSRRWSKPATPPRSPTSSACTS